MINIYDIFAGMNFRGFFACILFSALALDLPAQAPQSYNSADILHRIQKLKVLGSALFIAAHPDDENTELLSWLSKDQFFRTGYLSVTRGDGGQNLIGDEQGIELGLIRTQELLAARRIDGAEQFFTRGFDFGFSKSTEEALRFWDKEKVLGDVVWVIRQFQPDVIITRFPPDKRAGHGHHSASSVLAKEAFRLAADSNAYREQFKYGVEPWQAKRILWNSYVFGSINTISNEDMVVDVGGFNPLLGKSYGEIAAESRSQHKSQGFGVAAVRGSRPEHFAFLDGSRAAKTLTEGVNAGWSRIGAAHISTEIDRIIANYAPAHPAKSIDALVTLYRHIGKLPRSRWSKLKMEEIREIIAAAAGLWMEAHVAQQFGVRGNTIDVAVSLNNRNGAAVRLNGFAVGGNDTVVNKKAPSDVNLDYQTTLRVPDDMPVSQPYWLREKMSVGSFTINDQTLIGQPQSGPSMEVTFNVVINGEPFSYRRPVLYKHTDPVKGELYQPLVIIPSAKEMPAFGTLKHISYNHIPDIFYFNNDSVRVDLSDVKIAGKKIGYIVGAGDKVPQALTSMGYEVSMLQENDVTSAYLRQFDAVVTGVRAYNVRPWLAGKSDIINEYVRNGGNFIVQYNTNSFVGPFNAPIGPLPFDISRERITDEHSPVKFLLPQHPVLNFPNRISEKDFINWVQERGIYFAVRYDSAYATPLAMNDPGEEDKKGSLIIANYGKGKFVYTGLAFFRQLPAGVTGAYRLLANIIALNQTSK